ncbi:MAG: DUF3089 domain-containing protein [Gemmatimonadota bacterium]|nr:DUF3089 domain-containing protein [Gemmatimonadota bacterium]
MLRRAHYVRALVLTITPLLVSTPPLLAQSAVNDYSDPASWLCLPGHDDACTLDLTATVVAADGSLTTEAWSAAEDAPIDCFYVYPTVSRDQTPDSDMMAGPGENGVVRSQLARFASKCRVYTPLYRQVTIAGLQVAIANGVIEWDANVGYGDVVDAWHYYLEHYNDGRGVILMGHSQGTGVLVNMIAAEIDGRPVQDRMISAILLGNTVTVPEGEDVGGSFDHIPLCRSADQIGCVITYMSFRSTVPPQDSFFGVAEGEGMVAACTNPAALGGGAGELEAYFGRSIVGLPSTIQWTEPAKTIETEFVKTPGLVRGECVQKNGYSYLEVTVQGDPADARTDDIPGDLVFGGTPGGLWGLHLVDVSLSMGNLVDIVDTQMKAYLKR